MNLNQITIPSLDLEKSVPFYQKLGLQLIVDSVPRYVRFECTEGDATFSIHKVDQLPRDEGVIIYFEIKNLDEYVEQLITKHHLEFEELPDDKPWLWREARLKDPDGNQLILFHAGDNRKNPPWRIA